MPLRIEVDDLTRPQVHALLNEHLENMRAITPPQSVHALDLDRLRTPDITFWTAWDGPQLVGLRRLSLETGATEPFKPAHALYASAGFRFCGPFGEYQDDPHSVFMTLEL
jgi:putative acetyltransferase